MKKKLLGKILAVVLAVSCFVSTMNFSPVKAETKEEDIPSASEMKAVGENIDIKDAEEGVRLVFNREAPGWGRVSHNVLYDTREGGTEVEIKDIASADPDYSIALKFAENGGWFDTSGYLLLYGKSGYFSVIWTDGKELDIHKSEVLVSEIREELGDSLSVKIELKGSQYLLTVNGKAYSIPSSYVTEPEALLYTFGAMGDGSIKSLNSQKPHTVSALSYTVSKLSHRFEGAGYEPLGELISGSRIGMPNGGETLEFRECEEGTQVAFTNSASAYARVHFNSAFSLDNTTLHIALSHIYSASNDYSMVVRLGNMTSNWYDGPGYLIVYGKSGHFAIVGTDGVEINPNKGAILASEKREALDGKLTIDVVLKDDTYEITVNDKTYTVPTSYLPDPKSPYVGFGRFCDGDIRTLNYQKDFKKAAFSFVIKKETYEADTHSNKSLLPLAKYKAFMEGDKNGAFKPEEAITREEAILAMARLLVDEDDIKDVYSSDFTDIKKGDKYYDIIAYMERCAFIPDFGTELKPDQALTRGEFVELLTDPSTVSKGVAIADVSEEDDLYGKICYILEKGILTLDTDGKFNADATVTRGEAAKALCIYSGKTMSVANPKVTFSDVKETTEYADYILLAANEIEYRKETYKATSVEGIQACVNKAIELSKTTDALVTIELAEDVYKLTEPVTIDAASYGEYEVAIVIKNAEGTSPVITGNTDLKASDFKKVDGKDYYSYQLPETAKIEGNWPKFRDLYLNGERLQLARSKDYTFRKNFKDPVYAEVSEQLIGYANGMYVDSEIFANISGDTLSTLEICMNVEWNDKRFRVASINGVDEDTGLTELSVKEEEWNAYLAGDGNKRDFTDWTYWFENHLSLLDEPGEFYYDAANGVIYFYPYTDTDMSDATISYPLVEKLFDLKNTTGITFEGLTFTGTTSNFATDHGFQGDLGGKIAGYRELEENYENIHAAAIHSDYSAHLSVRNCTFDELGTNGIYLDGGNHNTVLKGNSFTDSAMCAAIFGKQNTLWSFAEGQSNLIIDNNYVYNIGTDYTGSPGFHITRTNNIAFTHNTMIHTPYSGLMIGWIRLPSTAITVHNAEVAYNRCEDNLFAMNDGAGLYFCGANALTSESVVMNRVHDNYIKSTGYTKTYNGIYLDMNASNYYVYKNVIEGYDTGHGPVFNQDHMSDQYTYNNTVADNFTTVRMITTTADAERNIQLINNQHFPKAADLPEEALAIIAAAGQTKEYAASVPVKDTVIEMDVKEPHIMMARQDLSDEDSVTFTITNNGKETASYSVVYTNKTEKSSELAPSTDALELKSGETGTIKVAFRSGDKTVRGELVDLAVVKDNGWKMQYHRVIDIDVNSSTAKPEEEGINIQALLPFIIGGAAVIVLAAVVTVVLVKKKSKKKKEAQEGIKNE